MAKSQHIINETNLYKIPFIRSILHQLSLINPHSPHQTLSSFILTVSKKTVRRSSLTYLSIETVHKSTFHAMQCTCAYMSSTHLKPQMNGPLTPSPDTCCRFQRWAPHPCRGPTRVPKGGICSRVRNPPKHAITGNLKITFSR